MGKLVYVNWARPLGSSAAVCIVASGSAGGPEAKAAGHRLSVPATQNCTSPVAATLAPVTVAATTTGTLDTAGFGLAVTDIVVVTAATTTVKGRDPTAPSESVTHTSNAKDPACVGVPESVPPGDSANPGGSGRLHG